MKDSFYHIQSINGRVPYHLKDIIVPYQPKRTVCSQSAGWFVIPRISKTQAGGRAFFQAPLLHHVLSKPKTFK